MVYAMSLGLNFCICHSGVAAGFINNAKDVVQLWSNTTNVINLRESNVGIGTITPTHALEVTSGATKTAGGLIIQTCAPANCPTSPETGQMWLVL